MESPPELPEDIPPQPPREPLLTLPGALTAYILLLAVIHLRVLLPPEWENWTIDVFGFIPKRYDSTLLAIDFPGGAGAKVWTFVTYSLLHANLSHIGFNVLWLLPFGSALVRRFGALRFFLFMAVQPRRRRCRCQGSGAVADPRVAQSARARFSRRLVRRQHHLRRRIDRDRQ